MSDPNHLQPPPQGAPPDYDPRRLFPFGLSPIPEVPSELASEVSSICPSPSPGSLSASCYESEEEEDTDEEEEESDDEDDDESDVTEVESVKSAGILYSGSCSSVKSNDTLNNEAGEGGEPESADSEEDSLSSEADDGSDDEYEEIVEEVVVDEEINDSVAQEGETSFGNDVADEHETVDEDSKDAAETNEEQEESESEEEEEEEEGEEEGDDYEEGDDDEEEEEEDDGEANGEEPIHEAKSGADTASEIFRHLQATRDKSEVKTELAKILSVLEKTLKEKEDVTSAKAESSSGSEETDPDSPKVVSSKPPKYPPTAALSKSQSSNSGLRQYGARKEETGILSKILVTLLCSCKSPEAADELKQVIRQFRDAAHEASDEVREELLAAIPSGRSSRSSKSSRKSLRTRRSSGSSSHSTDSQTNTLTPNHSEGKSSEDESVPNGSSARRGSKAELISGKVTSNIDVQVSLDGKAIIDQSSNDSQEEPNVSVTLTLPNGLIATEKTNETKEEAAAHEEEDWEWEEEEEVVEEEEEDKMVNGETLELAPLPNIPESPRSKRQGQMHRNDSTSSESNSAKDMSSSDGQKSETRKLLSEMEFGGAYNSDSLNSPGHSGFSELGTEHSEPSHSEPSHTSQASPSVEEEQSSEMHEDTDQYETCSEEPSVKKSLSQKQVEGHLFFHLEQTFKVLNGAYHIITGSQDEEEEDTDQGDNGKTNEGEGDKDKTPEQSFDEVLEGVSSNCADLETEIRKSTTPKSTNCQSPAAPPSRPTSKADTTQPRTQSRMRPRSAAGSRAPSRLRAASRTGSRAQSRQSVHCDGTEEDLEDDEEWEYYYEDEEGEEVEISKSTEMRSEVTSLNSETVETKKEEMKVPRVTESKEIPIQILEQSNEVPEPKQSPPKESRPSSRQKRLVAGRPNSRQGSRPNSRTGSRPVSRASRMGKHMPGIGENSEEYADDEDWEWEYYDEEEEELQRLSPTATTAPTTRATSPFPNNQEGDRANSFKQGMQAPQMAKSPIPTIKEETPPPPTPPPPQEMLTNQELSVPLPPPPPPQSFEEPQKKDLQQSKSSHSLPPEPISEVSVALAAEYLGQLTSDVVASLPEDLKPPETPVEMPTRKSRKKSKKSKRQDSGEDEESRKERKRKKKKKRRESSERKEKDDGKFLPKLGVKGLINLLEPKLFQDSDAGTRMTMSETTARTVIASQKHMQKSPKADAKPIIVIDDPEQAKERKSVKDIVEKLTTDSTPMHDPMDAKNVGRVLPKGDSMYKPQLQEHETFEPSHNAITTQVILRKKSTNQARNLGPSTIEKPTRRNTSKSPDDDSEEAYGTGSSCSEEVLNNNNQANGEAASFKAQTADTKPNRHSRLFRLLQDSDYTDSSDSSESHKSPENRISLKQVDDMANEPDLESITSIGSSLLSGDRKTSFKSIHSSERESDNESIVMSSASGKRASMASSEKSKLSPSSLRKRFMHLNIRSAHKTGEFDFSSGPSSELSTPTSPTVHRSGHHGGLSRTPSMHQLIPPTRVWNYLHEEFDSVATVETVSTEQRFFSTNSISEDSSYHSLNTHSHTPEAGASSFGQVEEASYWRKRANAAQPKSAGGSRVLSPREVRNSPKFEMELLELSNLPSAPTLSYGGRNRHSFNSNGN